MSKEIQKLNQEIYNLNKQCVELAEQKAKEFGKELEIKADYQYVILSNPTDFETDIANTEKLELTGQVVLRHKHQLKSHYIELCPVLDESLIRQTLRVFEPELGRNPDKLKNGWKETNEDDYNEEGNGVWSNQMQAYLVGVDHGHDLLVPETKSAALCQKWLDGLTPMFKTNQLQVLEEFLDTLKSIKKS